MIRSGNRNLAELHRAGIINIHPPTCRCEICATETVTKSFGPSFLDAKRPDGEDSRRCRLIVTEGLSSNSLIIASGALGIAGRDTYGVYALRGKSLCVQEDEDEPALSQDAVMGPLLHSALGLRFRVEYDTEDQ